MLMRQNIQNNDSLTIKTLYLALSPKMKRALFNHLVLLSFNTTFQRIQEFYVTFFFWFLEWVLQIFLIFVYTLRFSSRKVLTADKIRFPLLLVSCFISLFRPKDLTFPIFFERVSQKIAFEKLFQKFQWLIYAKTNEVYRKSNTFCFSLWEWENLNTVLYYPSTHQLNHTQPNQRQNSHCFETKACNETARLC